jgi:hypothetical protein
MACYPVNTFLLKNFFIEKNVSSQLDQHPGCRDGISDSKTKIKIKN